MVLNQTEVSNPNWLHPEHNPLSNEHHTKHIKQINKQIKKCIYLRVHVFSTKVLIGDTFFFTSLTERQDRHFLWRKGQPFAQQRQYIDFSVILRD